MCSFVRAKKKIKKQKLHNEIRSLKNVRNPYAVAALPPPQTTKWTAHDSRRQNEDELGEPDCGL